MNETHALRLLEDEFASLGAIRQLARGEVCQTEGFVWYRLQGEREQLIATLQTLPGKHFRVLDDSQLIPFGAAVPNGRLPEGPWIAIAEWLRVAIEPAAYSGVVNDSVCLRLARTDLAVDQADNREGNPADYSANLATNANVLLVDTGQWIRYACSAPQIRLDRWSFAVNRFGETVIRGAPPPPLAGTRFHERSGVAVEAGWKWVPELDADVAASTLGLQEGDLVLLHAARDWDKIDAIDFVRATRSAARWTLAALAEGGAR